MPATELRSLAACTVLAAALCSPVRAAPPAISPQPGPAAQLSQREHQFARLVSERARAIEATFGNTFSPWVRELRIDFLSADEMKRELAPADVVYDPEADTLYFTRALKYADAPPTTAEALQYWPWYEESLRGLYPLVEIIDDALWTAVLTEAARAHDLTWPHAQCASFDIAERLPCEMLTFAVAAYTKRVKPPLFNENRVADIWPENFAEFRARVLHRDEDAYRNVRKYGGYLLLQPLVREFGLARTLSYVAGTPFRVEQNNLRLSAQRYQSRAREALALHAQASDSNPLLRM